MAFHFTILLEHKTRGRRILHAIMAIITAILVLLWPASLYYIIGSYLIATGLLFLFFHAPTFMTALSMVTGFFIFIFPSFIPYLFAFFLLAIGLGTLLSVGFSGFAVIPLLAAFLLLAFPDIIAIIVALFLLLYGVATLTDLLRSRSKVKELTEVY